MRRLAPATALLGLVAVPAVAQATVAPPGDVYQVPTGVDVILAASGVTGPSDSLSYADCPLTTTADAEAALDAVGVTGTIGAWGHDVSWDPAEDGFPEFHWIYCSLDVAVPDGEV